jgi:hypothetical protein
MILQGDMFSLAHELWALRYFDAAATVLPDRAKELCFVLFDWEEVTHFVEKIEER